ncbi:type II toxin-antitoxin system RatA family toxin [Erythrobacter sp. HKB08]|uniref:type II toxin-antitoxin system RatA family toxin n=1 Tax=Erythrobacter sp. HKB08 TaxID=2502843 RepID=UPI001008ACD5|nr:type II toxin-antitoxin system RatA family toxin [Erythrobacter sp. HKB08]
MPLIREHRKLPYTPEQIFDLVADVDSYPKFLPWVVATRVRSNSETEMVADMVVGFKSLRERFTSRVEKSRPNRIVVHYVDGPMRNLDNSWQISATEDGVSEVDFCVDFTFKNRVFEAMAGQYVDRAFRKLMGAFEARAEELYGSSNSSAQTVA